MADVRWSGEAPDVMVSRIATPAIRIVRLRGYDQGVLDALRQALGVEFARKVGDAGGKVPRALGVAPGEWIVVGGEIDSDVFAQAAAGAVVAHLAEVGEGRIVYAVAGPRARDLIAKGCPIDLHPRAFGEGRCAQSVLAQVLVAIDRPTAASAFHIYADASYVQHLDRWFADALVEFRCEGAE